MFAMAFFLQVTRRTSGSFQPLVVGISDAAHQSGGERQQDHDLHATSRRGAVCYVSNWPEPVGGYQSIGSFVAQWNLCSLAASIGG